MKQYHDLCRLVLDKGIKKEDRTGTGTISYFGHQMRFDLQEGFPLLTTKELNFPLIVSELIWFIQGNTNIRFLLQNKNNIWNEWAFKNWVESEDYDGEVDMTDFGIRSQVDEEFAKHYKVEMKRFKEKILTDDAFAEEFGDLGPVYGEQWRSWKGANGKTYDQLMDAIEQIKKNPDSRRLIVSAWNPSFIISDTEGTPPEQQMALPPCHTFFQFYVANGKLSLQMYQRSCDIFIGGGFNISSYALLVCMVAQVTGLEVGEFVHTIGDAHIYINHVEQVELQLSRTPFELPTIRLNPEIVNIEDFTVDDVELLNYEAHPHIKGIVAV